MSRVFNTPVRPDVRPRREREKGPNKLHSPTTPPCNTRRFQRGKPSEVGVTTSGSCPRPIGSPLPPSRRGPANGAAASRAGRLTSAAVAAPIGRRRCDARAARGLLESYHRLPPPASNAMQATSSSAAQPPPARRLSPNAKWLRVGLGGCGHGEPATLGRPLNARRPPRSTPRARATKDGLSLPVNRFLTDHDDETGHGQTNHDIN
ncbi:hypothetical protein ACCO45_006945 [Purpureocillium lilacinum]|uniref:Uncharacterized protein n=1 Tax=Purpureocillium lilacinum TaxID=33203 RepID=A0ACC4DRQ1_PURLI